MPALIRPPCIVYYSMATLCRNLLDDNNYSSNEKITLCLFLIDKVTICLFLGEVCDFSHVSPNTVVGGRLRRRHESGLCLLLGNSLSYRHQILTTHPMRHAVGSDPKLGKPEVLFGTYSSKRAKISATLEPDISARD